MRLLLGYARVPGKASCVASGVQCERSVEQFQNIFNLIFTYFLHSTQQKNAFHRY